MATIKKPLYHIIYNKKDISRAISPLAQEITFEDSLENLSGSLSLRLLNNDHRWLGGWQPKVTDEIAVVMGYQGEPLLDCGLFFVDELSAEGSRSHGDVFVINALSNLPSSKYSAYLTKPYKGSFADFAKEIADSLGMQVKGEVSGELSTVAQGNGLAVLMAEGKKLGKIMKTEGNAIVFYPLDDVKKDSYRVLIKRSDVKSYQLSDRASGRYTKCEVRYWDRKTKALVRGAHNLNIKGGGTALIWEEVKDAKDAQDRAKRWLEDRNKVGVQWVVDMPGNVKLKSGVIITLEGFGNYDHPYYISNCSHRWSRANGYETSINIEKV